MDNLHYHPKRVSKEDKNKKFQHKSPVIWLTGLSGSGKSTVANALEELLHSINIKTHVLDGDNVRMGLNKDLDFSEEGRKENIRRIAEVSKLFADSGTLVITAFISPFIEDRENAKDIIDDFIEIHLDTPIEVCKERDPKGLYKKAEDGLIKNFTGIDSPYEAPVNPRLRIDTSAYTIKECAEMILGLLVAKGYVGDNRPKEIDNLDKSKTIAIDFDGVIHKYSKGFQGLDNAYDPPMEGAIESIKKLHSEGFILKILSSRPKEVIYPWLEKYGIGDLFTEVSNHKFPATIYIDDRGFHFDGWDKTMEGIYKHPKMQK